MDMLQFQDQPAQSQTGSTKTTSCGQGGGWRPKGDSRLYAGSNPLQCISRRSAGS